jgi:hypothetical protein
MTDVTVRGGVDTWVRSDKPTENFSGGRFIQMQGTQRRGFIKIQSPAPLNATVLYAELVFTQDGEGVGEHTITIDRVTSGLNFGQVTWNTQPGGTGIGPSITKAFGGTDGTKWVFDLTAYFQEVADGLPNQGLRLRDSGAGTGAIKFLSSNAGVLANRPYLRVVYSTPPDAPTQMKPGGSGAIAVAKPVLQTDYHDRSGATDMAAMQVQIDTDEAFGSVDFDSGEVPLTTPTLDLAATAYAGLANYATAFWRARLKDADNEWSGYADAALLARVPKGTVAITSPGVGGTVPRFTPTVTWTWTAPAGPGGGYVGQQATTQTHYQLTVARTDDPSLILYDSGKIQSASLEHQVPAGVLTDDQTYTVTLYVWDNVAREATVGDPSYVVTTRDFVVDYDPDVDPPDTLTVQHVDGTPYVDLTWDIPTAPDSFTIVRDDGTGTRAVATDLDPADLLVGGTTYTWRDYSATLEQTNTYTVKPEVAGALADAGPTGDAQPVAVGIWLTDPTNGLAVVLGGDRFSTEQDDAAEAFQVLGSLDVIRVVMGLTGLSGSMDELMISTRNGVSWEEYQRRLYAMKAKPASVFRLAFGDLNIPVVIGNLRIAPHPQTMPGQVLKSVSFDWWQTSEHPFSGVF